jgi:hypothetical protein
VSSECRRSTASSRTPLAHCQVQWEEILSVVAPALIAVIEVLPDSVKHERVTPEAAYKALAIEKQALRDRGHPLAQFVAD